MQSYEIHAGSAGNVSNPLPFHFDLFSPPTTIYTVNGA